MNRQYFNTIKHCFILDNLHKLTIVYFITRINFSGHPVMLQSNHCKYPLCVNTGHCPIKKIFLKKSGIKR